MKSLLTILLIGIILVSGCVSSPGGGGTTSSSSSGGPPAFPED